MFYIGFAAGSGGTMSACDVHGTLCMLQVPTLRHMGSAAV